MARARSLIPLAVSLALSASAARAETAIAPAEDGRIGAWLITGMLTRERCDAVAPENVSPRAGTRVGGTLLRPLAAASGAIDLARALGAGKQKGPCAFALAELALERELRGWLLVSADGPSDLWISGKKLWSRPDKRLRGGSWDPVELRLPAGRHVVVLRLEHPGEHWAFETRLLERGQLLPPSAARWELPGADAAKLAQELASVELSPGLSSSGYTPKLVVSFANGAPRDVVLDASVALDGAAALPLGRVPVGARAAHRLEASLLPLALGEKDLRRVTAKVVVGPLRAERSIVVSGAAPNALRRASSHAKDATVAWRARRLERAHPSEARLRRALRELDAALTDAEEKRDPLKHPGIVTLARWSTLDGEPEPLTVHVPASIGKDPARKYPLAVVLHGYNGTGRSVLAAFLDSDPNSRTPKLDGFVLAPQAYGNTFYRGPGEHEVLSAVDWALRTLPVDPERVSITGVSMGGTGSAFVALRHADRFSAASPLCGYHSYFVRRDTSNRQRRAWEEQRMHHWSPASFAENARNLPFWVAHGTKDWPLDNSRVLVERLKKLGYALTDEWPDIGHSVWEKTWDGARMWPWLSSKKRDTKPSRVTLVSDSLARGSQAWVKITRLTHPGQRGSIDATRESPNRVAVTADGVDAFELERDGDGAVDLAVGKTTLSFAAGEPLAARRDGGTWKKGKHTPAPGEKRAGVEGPIREVYDGPLVFVWGSGDPKTARANREVAEAFAKRHGAGIHYRVLADHELDAATEKMHSLFLVGTASDHRLLRELGPFPIRAGTGKLTASGAGAIFVHPNPRHPDRSVAIITGVDAAGIWRALSLPQLLPDFVIYDERLSPAAAEQILGSAKVIAAGFFDHAWKLPAKPEP